jgi:hypothetical protein
MADVVVRRARESDVVLANRTERVMPRGDKVHSRAALHKETTLG